MSIITLQELNKLPSKTLIYFPTGLPLCTIPGSYTLKPPPTLSDMIFTLRNLDIQIFPIICYDDGDLSIASRAYWIFDSMNIEVHVLHGGLKACEEEGSVLNGQINEDIPLVNSPHEVNLYKLPSNCNCSISIKSLPFDIYDVLGKEISCEKVIKLLESHNVGYEVEDCVVGGNSAAIFGLILRYLGRKGVRVYLGEWKELENCSRRVSTVKETFYSVAGTVYFDALSGNTRKESSIDDTQAEHESVLVEHYSVQLIEPSRTSCDYTLEHSTSINCRGCEIV